MVKWKKISLSILTSTLLLPSVPLNVFAEQDINSSYSSNTVEEEKELNGYVDYLYVTTLNIEDASVYANDEEVKGLIEIDKISVEGEEMFVIEEMEFDGELYALLHNEIEEIGWIHSSLLSENVYDWHKDDNEKKEDDLNDSIHDGNPTDTTYEDETVEYEKNGEELEDVTDENITKDTGHLTDNKEEPINVDDYVKEVNKEESQFSSFTLQTSLSFHTVQSTQNISYQAEVVQPWSINTRPWGTEGAELVASAREYMGQTIEVIQEKVTQRSTFALIRLGQNELGWIDTTGLKPHTISSTRDVNYAVEVTKPWSVNTEPWGIRGFNNVNTGNIVGQEYTVIKEAVTPRSTFVLLSKNGSTLGWIDITGVEERLAVQSSKDINYAAKVVRPWAVNSRPWGTVGSSPVVRSGELVGETVTVTREKRTERGVYSLISTGSKEIGWVDKTALEIHTISTRTKVDYPVRITSPWSINSLPWGIEGFSTVHSRATVGDRFRAVEEATTPRSTFVLLEKDGRTVGWIDSTGVEESYSVISTKSVSYAADIARPWAVTSQPFGVDGSKPVVESGELVGETVTVKQEKTTERATYALISIGNNEIGWIDRSGLTIHRVTSSRTVNYPVTITKGWSINSQPWGVEGFKTVQSATPLIGQEFDVIREATTRRSMYMLLQKNGQTIGWIDSTGVENSLRVLSTKNVNYSGVLVKPWSINTEPWGTKGSQAVPNYSQYLGKRVEVIQEKTTQRGTYALIRDQGRVIGWVDKSALEITPLIVLDPGHGGRDNGAHAFLDGRRINEKDLNLSISLKLRDRLRAQGYNVVMTRESDVHIEMVDRARMANELNADIFISIHHNSMPAGNSGVNGIETIYYTPSSSYPPLINGEMHNDPVRIEESRKLAHSVQNSLISSTGANYRRVFGGAYVVVRETAMPAIIPEFGFMSNPTELRKMTSSTYQEQLIQGMINGINNYFNN